MRRCTGRKLGVWPFVILLALLVFASLLWLMIDNFLQLWQSSRIPVMEMEAVMGNLTAAPLLV